MIISIYLRSQLIAKVAMGFEGATMHPSHIEQLVDTPEVALIVRESISAVSVHYYSFKKRVPELQLEHKHVTIQVSW